MDDFLVLVDDELPEVATLAAPWNILIVDDDQDIHDTTRHALESTIIKGRPLNLLSVYSGKEAREFLKDRTDIDLLFLDAVMETGTAGLETAEFSRKILNRKIPIIVVRSGFAAWEQEFNLGSIDYVDEFLLKSSTTRKVLVDTLTKWLSER